MRQVIFALTACTALIGVFEAMLFSMLGRVVDWLATVEPANLWTERRGSILLLITIIAASPLVVALQSLLKQQALAANFPMRLRWKFHRLMLSQSLGFYQDEFAGRIAAKVMQTALAVRDAWMIVAEILVFVIIYFVTMLAVIGRFDAWVLVPFVGWLALYAVALAYFVPRLGRVATRQADARSLMTGRITDAYTNIATVKLFSHTHREAGYARSAMQDFITTVYNQMRLVSGFEVVNHILSMGLIASTAGTCWLWTRAVGIGAVAAATAMASTASHWIMWGSRRCSSTSARSGWHQHAVEAAHVVDREARHRCAHRQILRSRRVRVRRPAEVVDDFR
jgi:ATP-binding cassette subfamily B multidrug efflux pump